MNFEQMPSFDDGQYKKAHSNKIVAIVIAVLALVVGAVIIVTGGLLMKNPQTAIASAVSKTFQEDNVFVNIFNELNNITKDKVYSLEFNIDSSSEDVKATITYNSGKEAQQLLGTVESEGIEVEFTGELTNKDLKLEVPMLSDKTVVYNYTQENNGALLEQYDEETIKEFNELIGKLYTELTKKPNTSFKGEIKDLLKELEVKEADARNYDIGGKKTKCKGYLVTITQEYLEDKIAEIEDSIEGPEEEVEQYVELLEELKNELNDSLKEIGDIDLYFYVAGGKLACIRAELPEVEEDAAIEIQFVGKDNRLDHIRFVAIEDEDEIDCIEIVTNVDGKNVDIEILEDDDTLLTITYNKKSGEYTVESDEGEFSGILKAKKNEVVLEVEVDGDSMSIVINNIPEMKEFDGETFDIGNADENEVTQFMTEINEALGYEDYDYDSDYDDDSDYDYDDSDYDYSDDDDDEYGI